MDIFNDIVALSNDLFGSYTHFLGVARNIFISTLNSSMFNRKSMYILTKLLCHEEGAKQGKFLSRVFLLLDWLQCQG